MSDHAPAKKPAAPAAPSAPVNVELIVILLIFFVFSGGAALLAAMLTNDTVRNAITRIHSILTTSATIIAMIAIVIIVYSFMRISEISAREEKKLGLALNWNSERKHKNTRWLNVEKLMTSLNSSDWKIAILEADNILDEVVMRMGYEGTSLGERMKSIEASDFPYLDEAWNAHKTRNAIAHKGIEYVVTRSEAEQTINIYHRIFKELGYM